MKELTTTLAQDEQVIERGLATFVEVGQALMRIRDGKKYEQVGFDGFVAYLESRTWGISRSRAYQMIDVAAVSTIVETNEAQARVLAPVFRQHKDSPPEVQAQAVTEVYEAAVVEAGDKPVTARIIEAVREKIMPKQPTKKEQSSTPGENAKQLKEVYDEIDVLLKKIQAVTQDHLVTSGKAFVGRVDHRAAKAIVALEQLREWAK